MHPIPPLRFETAAAGRSERDAFAPPGGLTGSDIIDVQFEALRCAGPERGARRPASMA
ncbi:3-isopropylmalate dehydratase small subunit [Burkholderia sp. IT-111MI5]